MEVNEAKDKPVKGSGTKDACYHKVKSRYSVWPSAYASGALVKYAEEQVQKTGATQPKEEYMGFFLNSLICRSNAMRKAGIEVEVVSEDCWDGYEKKGMKTMFGKEISKLCQKEED